MPLGQQSLLYKSRDCQGHNSPCWDCLARELESAHESSWHRLLSVRGSHRLCWKTAFVACTGIHSLQAPGFMSSLPERPLTIIARRAEKIARRSNCPTTLVELGEGAAMAIAAPQQPHNAVPLQPVFCLSRPPAAKSSTCVRGSSLVKSYGPSAIDHGPSGQYQDLTRVDSLIQQRIVQPISSLLYLHPLSIVVLAL